MNSQRLEIKEHVTHNIERYGRHFGHFYFKCDYNGVHYHSATIYPKTAINLLTNKIYFHAVVKQANP